MDFVPKTYWEDWDQGRSDDLRVCSEGEGLRSALSERETRAVLSA